MILLAVFIGGALGAALRHALETRFGTAGRFRWGMWHANVAASLLLGILIGRTAGPVQALLTTGFCGGLSTFSAYALHAVDVWDRGHRLAALGHIVGHLAAGLLAAALGRWLGATL